MNCNREKCKNEAKFEVVFLLREYANHPPAVSTPVIFVCSDHSDITWKDVYTEDGWRQICNTFLDAGYASPAKEHSCIEIRDIQKQQMKVIIPPNITKEQLKKNMEKLIGLKCMLIHPHKDAGKVGVINRISNDPAAVIKLHGGKECLVFTHSELMFLK